VTSLGGFAECGPEIIGVIISKRAEQIVEGIHRCSRGCPIPEIEIPAVVPKN
jgi:hypothetical protein